MNLWDFLKDKLSGIIFYLVGTGLIVVILAIFDLNYAAMIIIAVLLFLIGICLFLFEYLKKRSFYRDLAKNLEKLDKKYLVLETIPMPVTLEEKIMTEIMLEINKSMIEEIRQNKNQTDDFREYVEMWVHEIKMPITSLVLKCHNNQNLVDKNFLLSVQKINKFVEQILYYVRSENMEKDFVISEINLKDFVRDIVIKNKDDFLENNITLEIDVGSVKVDTDKKWLEFVLNQVLSNAIKYRRKKDAKIAIFTKEDKENVALSVLDNGIGISEKDLKNVFQKSFTGENGRNNTKSTGMGLYIAKKLCDKLGHEIIVESKKGCWTKVSIKFGRNNLYKF